MGNTLRAKSFPVLAPNLVAIVLVVSSSFCSCLGLLMEVILAGSSSVSTTGCISETLYQSRWWSRRMYLVTLRTHSVVLSLIRILLVILITYPEKAYGMSLRDCIIP